MRVRSSKTKTNWFSFTPSCSAICRRISLKESVCKRKVDRKTESEDCTAVRSESESHHVHGESLDSGSRADLDADVAGGRIAVVVFDHNLVLVRDLLQTRFQTTELAGAKCGNHARRPALTCTSFDSRQCSLDATSLVCSGPRPFHWRSYQIVFVVNIQRTAILKLTSSIHVVALLYRYVTKAICFRIFIQTLFAHQAPDRSPSSPK